jgi:hypothetical protein
MTFASGAVLTVRLKNLPFGWADQREYLGFPAV